MPKPGKSRQKRQSSGDPRRSRQTAVRSRKGRSTQQGHQQSSSTSGERLQKVLAGAGIASRREAEEIIREGRVKVDGQIITELGTRVEPRKQEIFVDGERLPQPKLVYYAVHKPTGVVCTARDPAGRPRVIDLLPPSSGRVFNVGRLDLSSEGLILVTNDGELANQLTHPRHGVAKVYEVQVAGNLLPEVLAQLRRGTHLAEGYVRPVDVRIKSQKKNSTILEMVLDEGRNREVRRLFARVGHKVQRLTRIAVGPIRLGQLPRGAYRPLSRTEITKLREYVEQSTEVSQPAKKVAPQRKRNAARGKALARGKLKGKPVGKRTRKGGKR